jgi:ABC-type Mn2+/Zn2+ transport system ATPase subunit/GNAT superfamily N-acetyltransferase
MYKFDITKEVQADDTFRVSSVCSKFDIQTNHVVENFKGEINLDNKEWNIGVIYGKSGSGKTTIAKQLFGDDYITEFDYSAKSIVDDMPKEASVDDITRMFSSVGFSSPPSWLKPYSVLSNGEKMRVNLARALMEKKDMIVFDEFTSVVDRNVAKIGSYAIQKVIRRNNEKFVAVSCHDDILEWLEPDWVFNTDTMSFFFDRQKYKRPPINIEIHECKREYWEMFRKYHYLDSALNNSSKCFLATIDSKPVSFIAVLHFPHPSAKNIKRVHRLVTLPDYQGIGIGIRLLEFVAKYFIDKGFRYTITTSTPSLMYSLKDRNGWHCKKIGRNPASVGLKGFNNTIALNRIISSWEYDLSNKRTRTVQKHVNSWGKINRRSFK